MNLPGELGALNHPVAFADFKRRLHESEWVVYSKKPFAGPEQVLEYVSRYTHRVAITNHRIKDVTNGEVSFEYKDYRDNSKRKIKKLPATKFIGRFMQHILPLRFVRIRYGGFLAGAGRKGKLEKCHELVAQKEQVSINVLERFFKAARRFFEAARRKCPKCETGTLIFDKLLEIDSATNIIVRLSGARGHPKEGAIYCN